MDKFQIFEYNFNIPELENAFNDFFYRYNLTALFTNEHRAGTITVSYADARSVINTGGRFKVEKGQRVEYGGAYHEDLKDFADLISMYNDNKSFEEALFKVIYTARSFGKLMTNIRKLLKYYESLEENRKHNWWNIVFYNKALL